jgi:hypothetical protein
MKRQYRAVACCGEPGCTEKETRTYSSQREYAQDYNSRITYKCIRHSKPAEVLLPNNLQKEITLVNVKHPHGKFWGGHSGFIHGNGYMAFASDFPEGTKLTITARIELPASGGDEPR